MRVGFWGTGGSELRYEALRQTLQYLAANTPECTFEIVRHNPYRPLDREDLNALDFVFVDPALLVTLQSGFGVRRLFTFRRRSDGATCDVLGGALICRADRNDIQTPDDLRGKNLVSTSELLFADWLSIRREFQSLGFGPRKELGKLRFVDEPTRVLDAVRDGTADAGAIEAGVLESMAAAGRAAPEEFRVLEFLGISHANRDRQLPFQVSTRLYPEWALACCPRAPAWVVDRVMSLLATPRGDAPAGFDWTASGSYEAVHSALRELRAGPYGHPGAIPLAAVARHYVYWFAGVGAALILMILVTSYAMTLNRSLTAEVRLRKSAEESLQSHVRRFEQVVACSEDWIWEADAQGRFTYSSSIVTRMMGHAVEDVLGRTPQEFFTTAERERFGSQSPLLAAGSKGLFREPFRFLTKEGRVVIHESTSAPIFDARNNIVGYRGVNRDVTKQFGYVSL